MTGRGRSCHGTIALVVVMTGALAAAADDLPGPREHWEPSPPPGDTSVFDVYAPPIAADAAAPDAAPGISQWTRTAGPDEHLIVAGYNFTSASDPTGERTEFIVFAQAGESTVRTKARVVTLEPYQAIIGIPADVPADAMIMIWPRNAAGIGRPVAVNQTELWYALPRQPSPGEMIELYGRNLNHRRSGYAWVYLKAKDADTPGVLLRASGTNPYKADFRLPADLPLGTYEVWAHNGHGGAYGWSPLHARLGGMRPSTHLKVVAPRKWDGPTLDVTAFGARGDDDSDDSAAVLAALAKANTTANSTIHFPAGTYYLSKPIAPVRGPDDTGVRITGAGMTRTFIKGMPGAVPNNMLHITGGGVEVRDLVLDINELGEARKFYREYQRPEHSREHYAYLEKVKASRDAIEAWKKKTLAEIERQRQREAEQAARKEALKPVDIDIDATNTRKKNAGSDVLDDLKPSKGAAGKKSNTKPAKVKVTEADLPPVPDALKPPPEPHLPDVAARRQLVGGKHQGKKVLITKEGYHPDLRFINCVLDAERQLISIGGIVDGLFENCDIVARECQLAVPQYTRIRKCNFYGRADAPVLMYTYGGWCVSITDCTGQDYMPNTYDTCMGRFFTVSAYGNRVECQYIGGNRTKDLTVQPTHFNQNSGEQIMWEFMPITDTLSPTAVGETTLTFDRPVKAKKLNWYSDAIIVAGKGAGQYRQVTGYDKATHTLTIARPWDVAPDTSSVIQIGLPTRRTVVYSNYLDAKPRAHMSESHIASAGVEPFGASVEMIVDSNIFHELRTGIATFSPMYFHYYANNHYESVRNGVRGGAGGGLVIRNEQMNGVIEEGFTLDKGREGFADLDIIEHSTAVDLPIGVQFGNRYNRKNLVLDRKTLLYKNVFRRGEAPGESVGVWTPNPEKLILEGNQIEGFSATVADTPK